MASQKFIVVFKDGVKKEDVEKYAKEVNDNGGNVTAHFDDILNGFAAEIPEKFLQQLQSLQGDKGIIAYIEPDGIVTTQ